MLNLRTQMVQPLSQGSSVPASFHGNLRDGLVGLNAGIYDNGNDDHKRLNGVSFKLDYSVSSSDFHHEKGFGNVPSNSRVDSFGISPAE
ncbi:hypothetical protein V6N11_004062 [Hibiscus sabdariffa]